MPSLYLATDIFLLPTLYDPFSNACLEALAAGRAVITTRANGFSEIIESGRHGTIVQRANRCHPSHHQKPKKPIRPTGTRPTS